MSEQMTSTLLETEPELTIRTSKSLGKIAAAMAKAQGAFPSVTKDQRADTGSYSYTYANQAAVLNAVRKPLSDNEIAYFQPTAVVDGQTVLVTLLVHSSGEWLEGVLPLGTFARPQDLGSALTYLKRYSIQGMCGVATEDDDAQQASDAARPAPAKKSQTSGPTSLASAAQVNMIAAKQHEREISDAVLALKLQEYEKSNSRELTKPQASELIDWMKKATDEDLDALAAQVEEAKAAGS